MDGYEATRQIRRMEAESGAKPTPIFALTAHAFADMAVRGYEAGFTNLLTKPIRKATLLEAIAGSGVQKETADERTTSSNSGFIVVVEEGMEDVVPGYLEKRRAEVEVYRSALAGSDFDTIRKLAHKMKGTGTGYGLPRLTELGAVIEKAAIADDRATLGVKIEEFAMYMNAIQLEYAPELR
jgi:CheY-like chemotaxis protein